MFPEVDDFIEIDSEGHPHNGLIGRVVSLAPNRVTFNLYGKEVSIAERFVKVKAKLGTRAHILLSRKSMHWELDSLDFIGLYVLMDIALWMRDYEWCRDIQQRMAKVG
ncbi:MULTISPECIES: hypothetical protein [Paenibacillus]|uniref:hypothetical protein n=1 Tax=Paenibacillus TaxID=44249 RepID=UPI000B84751B|nr:hypothetical protein [Paenibacillus amylolyticus]